MDPILTQSELEALLKPTEGEATKPVRTVDLVARDHQAYALLSELQTIADRLVFHVANLCARRVGTSCFAKADPVEVVPGARLQELLGEPRYLYGLEVGGQPAGLVALDALLGSGFMVNTLGGEPDFVYPEDLDPAPAERRIVFRFASEFVSILQTGMGEMISHPAKVVITPPDLKPNAAAVLV
ncbi:MAG: hypothetical protein V1754_07420, partial [Pseudomonadota bacterium]